MTFLPVHVICFLTKEWNKIYLVSQFWAQHLVFTFIYTFYSQIHSISSTLRPLQFFDHVSEMVVIFILLCFGVFNIKIPAYHPDDPFLNKMLIYCQQILFSSSRRCRASEGKHKCE